MQLDAYRLAQDVLGTDAQKAERLNAAHAAFGSQNRVSPMPPARYHTFGLSRRQSPLSRGETQAIGPSGSTETSVLFDSQRTSTRRDCCAFSRPS